MLISFLTFKKFLIYFTVFRFATRSQEDRLPLPTSVGSNPPPVLPSHNANNPPGDGDGVCLIIIFI